MKKAILIFVSYIPSKTIDVLRREYQIDTFYILPKKFENIFEKIKDNPSLNDSEIETLLIPVFNWIEEKIDTPQNFVLVMENFIPKIVYQLYKYKRKRGLKLIEDFG